MKNNNTAIKNRKPFEAVIRDATKLGTYEQQAVYRKENCLKIAKYHADGVKLTGEVHDTECIINKNKTIQSASTSSPIKKP